MAIISVFCYNSKLYIPPAMYTKSIDGRLTKGELLTAFMRWYFKERPLEVLRGYFSYADAFNELFSFAFLLKTLVSPWKNIRDEYPTKGLNIEAMMQTFFLNLTARGIGLVIRIIAMLTGIVVQATLLVSFALYVVLWMTFPILVPVLIVALLLTQ